MQDEIFHGTIHLYSTAEPGGGLAGATAPPKAEKKIEPPSFLQ